MESIKYKGVCPICGSKGVAAILGEEGKLAGTVRPGMDVVMHQFSGEVIDPKLVNQYPIGTIISTYKITIDICSNAECGALFAVQLNINKIIKGADLVLPSGGPTSDPGKNN